MVIDVAGRAVVEVVRAMSLEEVTSANEGGQKEKHSGLKEEEAVLNDESLFRPRKKIGSLFSHRKKFNENLFDDESPPVVIPSFPKRLRSVESDQDESGVDKDDVMNAIAYSSTGADRYDVKNQFTGLAHQEQEEKGKDAVSQYEERVRTWKEMRRRKFEKVDSIDGGNKSEGDRGLDGEDGSKLYKGQKNMNTLCLEQYSGPQRSNTSHIRISSVIDYARDVCKDYKETGYCGYGDNCKFLHDRGDYKSGWELDKEWEEQQEEKRKVLLRHMYGDNEEKQEKSNQLPFACHICRKSFVNPIETRCHHYFCEECAMNHYKTSKFCAICNEPTMGIFNVANNIIKKMKANTANNIN